MHVRRKNQKDSLTELIAALKKFSKILLEENENEAANDLNLAGNELEKHAVGTEGFNAAIQLIRLSFEELHELDAYLKRTPNPNSWTKADELYIAGSQVWNLLKRIH
jgi:hypothetical protein